MNPQFKNLLVDFYELTMGQAYFNKNIHNNTAYFDLFFRNVPDNASFVIANGIKKCAHFLQQFHFEKSDIDYLKSLNMFSENYLNTLSKIKFSGDMWAVEDGTVVFPNEPVITIKAPLLEAQLVETALLIFFNRSSLITTKANRIVRSAQGRTVMEFGSRRAQGESSAIEGAVDAYIGGVNGTACTQSGKEFGVPVLGTMAHSFVQSFATEFDAFKSYAESFPDSCTLLVDTYNTLKSGIPNAIRTYHEVLKPMGKTLAGIRIDSGDLAYLSKQARAMLDQAGLKDTKIVVSNALDENLIRSLILQGAKVDAFGVGENLITSKSWPVFGGVYKLVAIEKDNQIIPKIKISDNKEKVTNPHFKHIFRLYDKTNNKLIADILCIYDEEKPKQHLFLNHPEKSWVQKEIKNFKAVNIRKHMIHNGRLVYNFPSINATRQKVQQELSTLWKEALRFENPHTYKVSLSKKLEKTKQELLKNNLQELNQ